jgi:hypothetical protein
MNMQRLIAATLIGSILQIAMVVAGHWLPAVRGAFMFGGLGLSLVAGAIYGLGWRSRWGSAAAGGTIAGAVSAFAGITVSCLLGDVAASLLLLGTSGSAVTGLIGGLIARPFARRVA